MFGRLRGEDQPAVCVSYTLLGKILNPMIPIIRRVLLQKNGRKGEQL